MIGYGRQDISEEDISEVVATLRSDYLTQGPRISDFERSVATLCGVENGVAVNSATSALHLACIALEVGPGDTIWTSPITFVASANCGRYCGANVDFVDIDLKSNNLCVHKLEEKLEISKKRGVLPKVVIPVHMAGHSCNMKRIWELSKEYGFRVIEDASHALGGKYRDGRVGSCQFSDITVFSFHAVKIITTAEGGMALTKCDALSKKMRHYRSHGITRHPDDFINDACGPWYYEQHDLGFNYRMSDLQAALGISQVKRLERIYLRETKLLGFMTKLSKTYRSSLRCMTPRLNQVTIYTFLNWLNEIQTLAQGYFRIYIFMKLAPMFTTYLCISTRIIKSLGSSVEASPSLRITTTES